MITHRDPGDENDHKAASQPFDLSTVAIGRALRIKTRNSTYTIRKQAGGLTWRVEQTAAAEGGYTLHPNPCIAEIATNYLQPGSSSLWMMRESPNPDAIGRITRTSTIISIEELQ